MKTKDLRLLVGIYMDINQVVFSHMPDHERLRLQESLDNTIAQKTEDRLKQMLTVKNLDEVDDMKVMEKADLQRTLNDQPVFSNLNLSSKHTRGGPELFNLSEESVHSIRGLYLQSISVVESESDVSEMQDESVLND